MKYLLDTDIASYFLRGKNNLDQVFLEKGYDNIRISQVSVAELKVLAYKNPMSKINILAINNLADTFGVLKVDDAIWELFSQAKANYLLGGNQKGDLDILIASIANYYKLSVITNNLCHFEGMATVESWISG